VANAGTEHGKKVDHGTEKKELKFHAPTVVFWLCVAVLLVLTSIIAIRLGAAALYLLVTGWIVGPFFLYWMFKKIRRAFRRGGDEH
jgi:uncharacterized Tic20 family protein